MIQAEHKLEDVRIVSLMLHTIPQRTLLQTGVHELIFSVRFPFVLRCEYYNSPSHSKQASLIYLTLRRQPLHGLPF